MQDLALLNKQEADIEVRKKHFRVLVFTHVKTEVTNESVYCLYSSTLFLGDD